MFHVGQKVVCMRVWPSYIRRVYSEVTFPVKGQVYTIRSLGIGSTSGRPTVTLMEIRNPLYPYSNGISEVVFPQRDFRPVVETKTDISIFKEIVDKVFTNDKELV